ncbi:endonuclease domain-containing protein [Vibrio pelagius]|uniref:Endonuclease domain-containing protein n=1 Tax=Vibrio pelagius TaxID=28169 RepID=A0ABY5G9H4_VIBPE|nr:DUF559 domain-containing protein [Vibrio pelagius]UTT86839.1 endonuclease domain-containing protein [Vibrio pelagius]
MKPLSYIVVKENMDGSKDYILFSRRVGNIILSPSCKPPFCKNIPCFGCLADVMKIGSLDNLQPVLNHDTKKIFDESTLVYPLFEQGDFFAEGIARDNHFNQKYEGGITWADLDHLFTPIQAFLKVIKEQDETFTHVFLSDNFSEQVISRGCKAGRCPCVGCKIVDMVYFDEYGNPQPVVDRKLVRIDEQGTTYMPIYDGADIISKFLSGDPSLIQEFSKGIFDSPLEEMFYKLAQLDLHLYPQYRVGKYRLDFALVEQRIAIELDGHEYHKTKYQRTHDAKRDRWLYGQGWSVLRFTGTEIYKDLTGCINEICSLAGIERVSKTYG